MELRLTISLQHFLNKSPPVCGTSQTGSYAFGFLYH